MVPSSALVLDRMSLYHLSPGLTCGPTQLFYPSNLFHVCYTFAFKEESGERGTQQTTLSSMNSFGFSLLINLPCGNTFPYSCLCWPFCHISGIWQLIIDDQGVRRSGFKGNMFSVGKFASQCFLLRYFWLIPTYSNRHKVPGSHSPMSLLNTFVITR